MGAARKRTGLSELRKKIQRMLWKGRKGENIIISKMTFADCSDCYLLYELNRLITVALF
jgi:hypothetical protein